MFPTDHIIGILRNDHATSTIVQRIETIRTAQNLLQSYLPVTIHLHVQVANVTTDYLCLMVASPTIAFRITNKQADLLAYFHQQGYSAKEIRVKVSPRTQCTPAIKKKILL